MSKQLKRQKPNKEKLELLARALLLSSKKNKKAQKKLAKTVQKLSVSEGANWDIVLEHPSNKECIRLQFDLKPASTPLKQAQANLNSEALSSAEVQELLKGKRCTCCKKRCPLKSPKCSKGKKLRAAVIARAQKQSKRSLSA